MIIRVIKEGMEDVVININDKNFLNENLSKSDSKEIEGIFNKLLKKSNIDKQIKDTIKQNLKDELKSNDMRKEIVEVVKECLIQLYKELWTRRNVWINGIK